MCGPLPHRPNNQHRGHAMLHSRCIGTHRRALLSRFSICFCVCCLVFRFALCLYLPFGAHTGNSGHHHQPYTNHTYLLLYAPVCVCAWLWSRLFLCCIFCCVRQFADSPACNCVIGPPTATHRTRRRRLSSAVCLLPAASQAMSANESDCWLDCVGAFMLATMYVSVYVCAGIGFSIYIRVLA